MTDPCSESEDVAVLCALILPFCFGFPGLRTLPDLVPTFVSSLIPLCFMSPHFPHPKLALSLSTSAHDSPSACVLLPPSYLSSSTLPTVTFCGKPSLSPSWVVLTPT